MPGSVAESAITKGTPTKRARSSAASPSVGDVVNAAIENTISKIGDIIRAEPAKALSILEFAQSDGAEYKNPASEEVDSEAPFPATYTTLSQVPIKWLKETLPGLHDALTTENLTAAEKASRGTVQGIFFGSMCISGKTKWHKFAKNKQVLRLVLRDLHVWGGLRLTTCLQVTEHPSTRVVSMEFTIWKFEPEEGDDKTGVKLIPEDRSIELTAPMTLRGDQQRIFKNYSELGAYVQIGRRHVLIVDMISTAEVDRLKTNSVQEEFTRLAILHQSAQLQQDAMDFNADAPASSAGVRVPSGPAAAAGSHEVPPLAPPPMPSGPAAAAGSHELPPLAPPPMPAPPTHVVTGEHD